MTEDTAATGIFELFKRDKEAISLYNNCEDLLLSLPGVKRRIHKTQVTFSVKRGFAWVWPPVRKVSGRPEHYIVVSFISTNRIDDMNIEQSYEPYPNRFTNHVIFHDKCQFEGILRDWLKMAHYLALR